MEQSWIMGLLGGLLIGLGGAVYLLGNGRIMGASGIIGGLVDRSGSSQATERVVFLAALVGAPAVASLFVTGMDTYLTSNLLIVVLAGLLVGVGTRVANGCTSGHGVCGISRLSVRGIVATMIYILAGVVTVALVRLLLGGV
ncbi:hypothetical protein SuNHUV7_36870 (plasmid) [Pseudoseohaeicola sp. NH-UV-7]|uniref:YeeE/YedE family protein n=1 Tax=unclassified Sulfitobacter TaxID=196795 RepID=UPI000E0A32DC|nr:YeeE/YedE thiosulfate transporter family protein [Sulfitobacter sp. JL08]AXI54449.1 hypothetical protein C1J05_08040 [Sulfitobacter sp. JL08]